MSNDNRVYGTIATDETVRVQRPSARRNGCSAFEVCAGIIVGFLALFTVAVLLFYLWLLQAFGNPTPGNPHPKKQPDFSVQEFAVGFDLTAGYGTAAISYLNGSTINVGKIARSLEYTRTMRKLSLESSQHSTPPYYGHGYEADFPRQVRRRARKVTALPASNDVAALAYVLNLLRATTEHDFGPFKYVFVTVPHMPALYNEDLLDACDHVGLQLLTLAIRSGDSAQWPVTEINTAMAGNGVGMCDDFRNATHCAQQIHCPEKDDVFGVMYTAEGLTAHVSPICSAMYFYGAAGIANFSLGYEAASESPGTYWSQVRAALQNALNSYLDRGHKLGLVVAHGEGLVHEPFFTTLLKEEVKQAQFDGQMPAFTAKDPIFAGARGAAEFGKRCMTTNIDCIPNLNPQRAGW